MLFKPPAYDTQAMKELSSSTPGTSGPRAITWSQIRAGGMRIWKQLAVRFLTGSNHPVVVADAYSYVHVF